MIRTFRSKALAELWSKGRTAKIDAKLHKRIVIRLDRLNVASTPEQMYIFPRAPNFTGDNTARTVWSGHTAKVGVDWLFH